MANAANIGVVFGQRSQLYWDLPLRESFELLRSIYDVPRDRYLQNMKHFAEILDLERFLSTPVRQLSLGERMRGDFAAAMLHDPQIVYLDEPTIGLDVIAKEAIREFIGDGQPRARHDGDPHHARPGRRRAALARASSSSTRAPSSTTARSSGCARSTARTARWSSRFAETYPEVDVAGAEVESREANTVRLRFNRRELTAEALIRRVTERYQITDVSIIEPDIESIVRRIYLEGYHDGARVRTTRQS